MTVAGPTIRPPPAHRDNRGWQSYKPFVTVAINTSAHAGSEQPKANRGGDDRNGVRFATIPTNPRIKATIQVICFGALYFI